VPRASFAHRSSGIGPGKVVGRLKTCEAHCRFFVLGEEYPLQGQVARKTKRREENMAIATSATYATLSVAREAVRVL
jgi:hypothetical protein